ncbi:hypothetical protein CD175_12560 [Pseudomonas laurylsulfatiphila]|uniref:Uncharacterized protein n=1 Tax=Pseudomonas laurylsulfatiphila TaxID=2011015 RepID=A0A2S6FMN6_9PSED|nr:hypothetical protein CD175_12560 [Pseudomonas laurylsulfatiphila]
MGSRQHVRRIEILQTCFVQCGSEPARDSGVSVDINVECQTAFASRFAPTGVVVYQATSGALA